MGVVPDREGRLTGQVRELVREAGAVYADGPGHERVDELARRLDEPLRIAVLAAAESGQRSLVDALVGTATAAHRSASGPPVPIWFTHAAEKIDAGPDAVVAALPAPALRAMTVIAAPVLDHEAVPAHAADPAADHTAERHVWALLGTPGGDAAVADAFVLLLHYGSAADLRLLDLLHAAGHRGVIGVLARADEAGSTAGGSAEAGGVADRAAEEYGRDPAVRQACQAVVPVALAAAAAAARLGDDEYRLLREWAAANGAEPGSDATEADAAEGVPALLDRLGASGARQALGLLRSGEGAVVRQRAELAAALVRHSGLAPLRELIATRFVRRAHVLRARSVLAGLEALLRTLPPAGEGARRLRYQLERVRTGAHELREIELLDVLRSGDLPLPDDERLAAERLLGANGGDVRARLGLASDATTEQLRAEAARQPARWKGLAAHPMTATRVREAANVLVRTCEQLVVEVDDRDVPPERQRNGSAR